MPSTLSPAAKSKLAAAAAVVMAGVTAWQLATSDGFTWLDVVPVVAAVAGAAAVDLIPNSSGQPKAKAIVHWSLSAVSAVASAVAALVASDPAGVTAVKLLVTGAGAFLVWYVPELASDVHVIEGEVDSGGPVAKVLGTVAADVSRWMGPDLAAPAAAARPAPDPAPAPAPPAPVEPTPIGDAAHAAALTTQPLPAVVPTA